MLYENVVIKSVAAIEAPHTIASEEVAERLAPTLKRLGVPGNPLIDLAGIHERRLWDVGMQPSDGATLAAHEALARADIDPKQVGILINTSVSRDFLEPSTKHRKFKRPFALSLHPTGQSAAGQGSVCPCCGRR